MRRRSLPAFLAVATLAAACVHHPPAAGVSAAGVPAATPLAGPVRFLLVNDTLLARIRQSHFRWLSANCTRADGTAFPGVPAWDTMTVNGVRVGLFGLTLVGNYRGYVRCADPDTAAHGVIAALRAAGAQ